MNRQKAKIGLTAIPLLMAMVPTTGAQVVYGGGTGLPLGQEGGRQRRDQAAEGINPLERVDSRIQSRVQSRIRNRLDGSYDAQANAASRYQAAGDQARRSQAGSR